MFLCITRIDCFYNEETFDKGKFVTNFSTAIETVKFNGVRGI